MNMPINSPPMTYEPIHEQMIQLILDFNQSNEVMEHIDVQAKHYEQTLTSQGQENYIKERLGELDNNSTPEQNHKLLVDLFEQSDAYINFAIAVLKVSADDLVQAKRLMDKHPVGSIGHEVGQALERYVHMWFEDSWDDAWLKKWVDYEATDEPVRSLRFIECVELLEQEIRRQSLGVIDIPEMTKRADELAHWIKDNPYFASRLLNNYESLFCNHNVNVDDTEQLFELIEKRDTVRRQRAQRQR